MLNVTAINFRKKSHERDLLTCRCVSSEHGVGSCRLNMLMLCSQVLTVVWAPAAAVVLVRMGGGAGADGRWCWCGRAAAGPAQRAVHRAGCGRGAHGSGSSGNGGEFSNLGTGQ